MEVLCSLAAPHLHLIIDSTPTCETRLVAIYSWHFAALTAMHILSRPNDSLIFKPEKSEPKMNFPIFKSLCAASHETGVYTLD